MKRAIRRLSALLLSVCLLFGMPAAEASGALGALESWLDGVQTLDFEVTAQFESLVPYGDDAVAMLNALLRSLSAEGSVQHGGAATQLAFRAGEEELFTLTEKQMDVGTALTTSLLKNRVLVSADSAMDALSGFGQEEASFDFDLALAEAEACYRELTEAIIPFAEEKTASYSIKNIGSARWTRLARLTPEQSAQIQPQIAKVLGCGMDSAFREQLSAMECQKSFVVALYQSKEGGDDMAVYIKGNVRFPDGALRAISYQWAFKRSDDGQRVDTYKFEMTKSASPRDNRTITGTAKTLATEKMLALDVTSKAIVRNPETAETVTTTVTRKMNGENGEVSGTLSTVERTAKGDTAHTVTVNMAPDLTITVADGAASLTGTLHIEKLAGQNTHLSAELLFGEKTSASADAPVPVPETPAQPQSSLTQNMDWAWNLDDPEDFLVGRPPIGYAEYAAPGEETVIDLDSADDAAKAALMDELSQQLAGRLLKAVAGLPEEAVQLFRDNMNEADWASILELVQDERRLKR